MIFAINASDVKKISIQEEAFELKKLSDYSIYIKFQDFGCLINLVSNASFRYKKRQKEALAHFKHVIKIFPNRGHIFRNKLWNTWTAILRY